MCDQMAETFTKGRYGKRYSFARTGDKRINNVGSTIDKRDREKERKGSREEKLNSQRQSRSKAKIFELSRIPPRIRMADHGFYASGFIPEF